MIRINKWLIILGVIVCISNYSCKKEYFNGGNLQKGIFNMSSYEFLKTKPFLFDTLTMVIEQAGLKETLDKESITFFAPTDHSVKKVMDIINSSRYFQSKDSIFIKDIPQSIWRKHLAQYIFKDKYLLKDIARYSLTEPNIYPGQYMTSYDGFIMNLGVQFSDYQGTKDVGPRAVYITKIGDLGSPINVPATVATSDLQTTNGVIHVLDDLHYFSFDIQSFSADVLEYFR
ncbi:fasciclin domain-containing protein [Pedobacter nyackensis]|uniref:fasciclin domain-containing protein n=1 Tax=Pedobacter nyackensis TaxID=475255 RepID=UPI0029302807|nr:fasciclin domain-containing protein [Pedobacter nyackensis]